MLDPRISKMLTTFVLINCLYISMDQRLDIRKKCHKAKRRLSTATYPNRVFRDFLKVRLYFQDSLRRLLPDWIQAHSIHILTVQTIFELHSHHVLCTIWYIFELYSTHLWTLRTLFDVCSRHIWTVRPYLNCIPNICGPYDPCLSYGPCAPNLYHMPYTSYRTVHSRIAYQTCRDWTVHMAVCIQCLQTNVHGGV